MEAFFRKFQFQSIDSDIKEKCLIELEAWYFFFFKLNLSSSLSHGRTEAFPSKFVSNP